MSSNEADPTSSSSRQESNNEEERNKQMRCLLSLRQWVFNDSEIYGRTDEKFLLMYLNGCKFNVDKAKKKVRMYYENRRKLPQWWAERNLRDDRLRYVAEQKMTTVLVDRDLHQPTIAVSQISRSNIDSSNFDEIVKMHTIIMEIVLYRRNCQLNGAIWILDCKDYPLWIAAKAMNPSIIVNIVHSFLVSTPVQVKRICLINTPAVALAVWAVLRTFVPTKISERIHFYRSDWKHMLDKAHMELLPEEYGGKIGPIKQHDDVFLKEVLSFTDYFADDNKYGYMRN